MKLTFFKVGLILAVIGVIWLGYVFSEAEKISKSFNLNEEQTATLDILLLNSGIGFYKITIPEFERDSLFIQVLEPNENIIDDKKIETKMSVNFFEFKNDGNYLLKITNISNKPIKLQVEFGDSNSSQMRIPGIVLFIGVILMIIVSYQKLRNYNMAQPDEKIS